VSDVDGMLAVIKAHFLLDGKAGLGRVESGPAPLPISALARTVVPGRTWQTFPSVMLRPGDVGCAVASASAPLITASLSTAFGGKAVVANVPCVPWLIVIGSRRAAAAWAAWFTAESQGLVEEQERKAEEASLSAKQP
jgi:hypothetical protein